MFKNIDFSEESTNVTPYDSDNESTVNLSPSTSRQHKQPVTKNGHVENLVEDIKENNETDLIEFPGKTPNERLPAFKKRPLNDTPITTTLNSPCISATPSPPASSLTLGNYDKKTTTSVSPLQNGFNTSQENENTLKVSTSTSTIANSDNTEKKHLNVRSHNSSNEGSEGDEGDELEITSPSRFSHPKRRPTTIDVPGLTKSKTSPNGLIAKEDSGSKLVIVMVGLPATGKSFITNKLSRYLNYSLYYCKVFNVGNTRRQYAKDHHLTEQDSNFFNPDNENSAKLRDKWALDTLNDLLDYLLEGTGSVGIFDATNTTMSRRKLVLRTIRERSKDIKVLFLESICTNKSVVENNIKLKLFGPDYKGKDPEKSLKDFKGRLANYLTAYEPVEDHENLQYIKMIDVGKKVIAYKIEGFLASQTVYYLLNFNLAERQIWITRNGESEDNVRGRLGGNSELTSRGVKYARALAAFIDEQRYIFSQLQLAKMNNDGIIKSKDDIVQTIEEHDEEYSEEEGERAFYVWTSMRTRSIETAQFFNEDVYPVKQMRMLDELNAGDYESMTYAEIQQKYPDEFAKRQKDKITYRYPGIAGESYMDVINRLRPVITELERIEDSALIVTHRVIARALLGYYMNLNIDIISNLDVPLHCVYCLEPKPYGITWSLWEYDEEKDSFTKVPQSDLNTTTVQEIGLVNKERRFSVVPTAPAVSDLGSSDFLRRRTSVSFSESGIKVHDKTSQQHDSEHKNSDRPVNHPTNHGHPLMKFPTYSGQTNNLHHPAPIAKSALMRNDIETKVKNTLKNTQFEIGSLEKRLSKLHTDRQ